MASVRSLGVHTPSALSYLVAESALTEDASEKDYTWDVYHSVDIDTGEPIEEEVLATDRCVIWSQGGVVQKVFNVEIEDQTITQAILTRFPTDQSLLKDSFAAEFSKSTSSNVHNGTGQGLKGGLRNDEAEALLSRDITRSRALVVFLKVQAHVFFLSGPNHIVSLPFEVERAFESPRGLIIQRKILSSEASAATPSIPAAPFNSFLISSQSQSQSFRLSSSQTRSFSGNLRRGKATRGDSINAQFLEDLLKGTSLSNTDGLPRLFSFTDPLSEFGLVAGSEIKPNQSLSRSAGSLRDSFQSLDRSEEIIYISPNDKTIEDVDSVEKPFILVVTENADSGTYSIWHASFADSSRASASKCGRRSFGISKTRRRSSYVYTPATGATTPSIRTRDVTRDSFGPATRSKTAANSFSVSQGASQSKLPTAEETFASQLDPDYNLTQAPMKESRRVSSLISRTDLSNTFDRNAFQDLATQRTSLNASFSQQSRRGQSFGSQGDRLSLGGLSQGRLRASTPGSISRMSFGTSVDDTIEDLDDLEDNSLDDLVEEMHLGTGSNVSQFDSTRSLRKELLMIKVFEVPVGEKAPIFKSFIGANVSAREYPKVHVLQAPSVRERSGEISRRLFVHIIRRTMADHLEIELSIKRKRIASTNQLDGNQDQVHRYALVPEVVKMRRPKGYLDAIRITDKSQSRLLCLSRASSREQFLSLHCGWAHQISINIRLCPLRLYDPFAIVSPLASTRKAAGLKRTLQNPGNLQRFLSPDSGTTFDILDDNLRRHKLQLQISPRNPLVSEIIQLLQFIFPSNDGDIFLSIWWSILKLCASDRSKNLEWSALVATLFTLVTPLIDPNSVRETELPPAISTPKRHGLQQNVLSTAWDAIWKYDGSLGFSKSWNSKAWNWAKTDSLKPNGDYLVTRPRTRQSDTSSSISHKRDLINYCLRLSRLFNKSSLGTAVNDYWRRMSTKLNQDIRLLYVPKILVALHLLREERKLNTVCSNLRSPESCELAPVLAQLGHWLQWRNWAWGKGLYYDLDGGSAEIWAYEDSRLKTSRLPSARWESPPSIFEYIEKYNTPGFDLPFPSLDQLIGDPKSSPHFSHVVKDLKSKLTPRTAAIFKYLRNMGSSDTDSILNVELTVPSGIDVEMLETFPESALAPINEAIMICQASPPTTWKSPLLALVGRQDLNILANSKKRIKYDQQPVSVLAQNTKKHEFINANLSKGVLAAAIRDVHTVCQSADLGEAAHSSPESDRLLVTRLIFSEDRRFLEAVKMLEPLKQTVAECVPDPNWSEAEHLDAQKAVMQWVMLRTFALPPGNAMIKFNSKRPLLTEKYALHGFTTSCLMKPMNNVVTADRTNFTEERYAWAFFHSGVSAGLTISRHAEGIDTSWIVFNKPSDLTNKHAGLLLGLGLNGHLKNLAKWLSFKYLTPKHTMTTIGLLLGLSASFLGSMDTLVTRLLSVHITRMLPPGAAELNLSPLTQTAGLMGIGLLYYNTQHRRMSEIMLTEIEHVEISDPADPPDNLHNEGYRLAAGFALGLINLGKGNDLKGLHDMRLIERLLTVAVGTKSVDVVHILDQATAGATIAIALIFMKTQHRSIAEKINVPDTAPLFDYVRPDVFLLRTLAKHLILWDDIRAEQDWLIRNLPADYRGGNLLSEIKSLQSEHMPFYNIVAGLLWSVGLKYAGSGDIKVRDFLIRYLDQFMRICRLSAIRYDARLTRNTTRNCQDLIAISLATVMSGTGDLEVLRRLRVLHGRVNPDTPYGSHLAAHFALGALFIAGGTFTFGTSNLAVAALVCSFYPLFPMDVLDNKAHLQAFRHLWVLAGEPRCLIVRDIDTHRAVSVSVLVNFKNGGQQYIKAPCLLPDLDSIESIRTNTPDYWPAAIDFEKNPAHLVAFRKTQTLQVRRRIALDAHSSTFTATLTALNDTQSSQTARLVWDWIFALPKFRIFDMADVSQILPIDGSSSLHLDVRGTVVDNQLVLMSKAQSSTSDDLRDLRCVLAWAEGVQARGGRLRWLGREVVERLRIMIAERARQLAEITST